MKIEVNGTALPVDPRFVPVCTLDGNGKPIPLSGSGGGVFGGATEAKQDTQITQAEAQLRSSMGIYGSSFIDNSTTFTGDYYGLTVVTDAQISAITLGANSSGGNRLVGISLSAGQQILVHITSIKLASGVVQLIKAPTPFPA